MPNTGGPLVISRGSPSTTPAPRSRGDGQGVEHAHSWYFAVAGPCSRRPPRARLRGGAAKALQKGTAAPPPSHPPPPHPPTTHPRPSPLPPNPADPRHP